MDLLPLKDQRRDKRLRSIPKWMTWPPILFMFLGILPSFWFSPWWSRVLGIPVNRAIRNDPHGGLYILGFLTAFFIFLMTGYALGYAVDALVLRYCYRWDWRKIGDLILESKVPEEWTRNM